MKEIFRRFARRASEVLGNTWAFIGAISILVVWAITGPLFGYSDSWQLVINTGTSVVTFLMVFMIQNTQNRDTMAIHLKLDELIRSISRARNSMIDLDRLSDDELHQLHQHYLKLCPECTSDSQAAPPDHHAVP